MMTISAASLICSRINNYGLFRGTVFVPLIFLRRFGNVKSSSLYSRQGRQCCRGGTLSAAELGEKSFIETPFGETLSWDYLCYAENHQPKWNVPTYILYGEKDELTSYETISAFSENTGAALTVMPEGEHWFHTDEQMAFLDGWIKSEISADADMK